MRFCGADDAAIHRVDEARPARCGPLWSGALSRCWTHHRIAFTERLTGGRYLTSCPFTWPIYRSRWIEFPEGSKIAREIGFRAS